MILDYTGTRKRVEQGRAGKSCNYYFFFPSLQSLTGKYREIQGKPCNENREPAMRTGFPCNESRFFPVGIDLQGNPVSYTGFGFAVHEGMTVSKTVSYYMIIFLMLPSFGNPITLQKSIGIVCMNLFKLNVQFAAASNGNKMVSLRS